MESGSHSDETLLMTGSESDEGETKSMLDSDFKAIECGKRKSTLLHPQIKEATIDNDGGANASYASTGLSMQPAVTPYIRREILPDKFSGKIPWTDYQKQFEFYIKLNDWTDEIAGDYLAISLQGPALKVLGNIAHTGQPMTYKVLSEALDRRFGPGGEAESFLLELSSRRRMKNESLQELGQEIRNLTGLAYPDLDVLARERLARLHFSEAVNESEIRAGIFRAKPSTLDEAIRAGLETESFLKAENARTKTIKTVHAVEARVDEDIKREVAELKEAMMELTSAVERIMFEQS